MIEHEKKKANSIDYLRQYTDVTNDIVKKIERHCKKYNIEFNVCAWYSNWSDFCSDWCDICGYTRAEARKLLHGGLGEFQIIENIGIVRYVM